MAVESRSLKSTRTHWITPLFTGVTYALALLALTVLMQHALVWGGRTFDNLRYGMPRRVHLEGLITPADTADVPTHLIGLNLHGQISVLVLPGGAAEQVQVLAGPYLVGADGRYVVPELDLEDLTGDGLSDLLLTVRGEAIVYVNDGGILRLMTPEERAGLVSGL